MNDQKQIAIETKISHNEINIEELQEAVREHQRMIDSLTAKFSKLSNQIDSTNNEGPEVGRADEKPPHY